MSPQGGAGRGHGGNQPLPPSSHFSCSLATSTLLTTSQQPRPGDMRGSLLASDYPSSPISPHHGTMAPLLVGLLPVHQPLLQQLWSQPLTRRKRAIRGFCLCWAAWLTSLSLPPCLSPTVNPLLSLLPAGQKVKPGTHREMSCSPQVQRGRALGDPVREGKCAGQPRTYKRGPDTH